jgi:PIN domain nuclease of toxin-antitoxin system
VIHLDTHVVVWLFLGDVSRLQPVRAVLDAERLATSAIVALELEHLFEIGRLRVRSRDLLDDLRVRVGLEVRDGSLRRLVSVADGLAWTRDPFDRLIVAHSLVDAAPLLTRDEVILANCASARWS